MLFSSSLVWVGVGSCRAGKGHGWLRATPTRNANARGPFIALSFALNEMQRLDAYTPLKNNNKPHVEDTETYFRYKNYIEEFLINIFNFLQVR